MKLLLPVAALLVLTACGGSSGDAGSPNTLIPPIAVKTPLKITAMQSTTCGGTLPATTAELLIYDDNWKITGRYKAGTDGSFLFNTDLKLINFSVLNNVGDKNNPKIVQEVYSQVEPGDFGTIHLGETSQNCECIKASANITKLGSSPLTQMRVSNESMKVTFAEIKGNTATFNLCRQVNKNWPALAISARNTAGSWAYAHLENYQPTQPLLINLDKEVQVLPFSSNNHEAQYDSYSYTKDLSFRGLTANSDAPVLINGLNELRYVNHSSIVFDIQDGGEKALVTYAGHDLLQKAGDTRALNFILPERSRQEAFLNSASRDLAEVEDGLQYDYSQFNEFTAVDIFILLKLAENGTVEQKFTGPLKGKIPESFLPADYLAQAVLDKAELIRINIELSHLSSANNITAYVKQQLAFFVPSAGKKERNGDTTFIGISLQ